MPGVALCRDCGAEIWWLPTPHDKIYPPMEQIDHHVGVLIDGILHYGPGYQLHECDPKRAEEFRASGQDKTLAAHKQAMERYQFTVYKLSMEYRCDQCGALEGQPCENLRERRYGRFKYCTHPHLERQLLIPMDELPHWTSFTEFELR